MEAAMGLDGTSPVSQFQAQMGGFSIEIRLLRVQAWCV